MRAGAAIRALALLALLAGCEGLPGGESAPPETPPGPAAPPIPDPVAPFGGASGPTPGAADLLPLPGGAPAAAPARTPEPQPDAPEIYMALQQDSAEVVSVIFAIDEARNNTPSDDPAIRITPEAGLCNPQQLRRYEFPELYAARPVYSRLEAESPVPADRLPSYLATIVSTEMVRQGLAETPDDTRPQNMCTYLLWERLVFADLQSQLTGQ